VAGDPVCADGVLHLGSEIRDWRREVRLTFSLLELSLLQRIQKFVGPRKLIAFHNSIMQWKISKGILAPFSFSLKYEIVWNIELIPHPKKKHISHTYVHHISKRHKTQRKKE
jgi:hypothetical protein